jgi:hypothetical protein
VNCSLSMKSEKLSASAMPIKTRDINDTDTCGK